MSDSFDDFPDLGPAGASPGTADAFIDIGDAGAVRRFVREYLGARQRPLGADDVHELTATISRYKGPPLIRRETLESFLAVMLAPHHA